MSDATPCISSRSSSQTSYTLSVTSLTLCYMSANGPLVCVFLSTIKYYLSCCCLIVSSKSLSDSLAWMVKICNLAVYHYTWHQHLYSQLSSMLPKLPFLISPFQHFAIGESYHQLLYQIHWHSSRHLEFLGIHLENPQWQFCKQSDTVQQDICHSNNL